MARPRVFVSSTYFDLRVIRADLERFIREIGYEPVLFERGHVPYGREESLEDYCYREVASCDILVGIIGGKFGSESKDEKHSITQRELKTALDLGTQIYIFLERSVHSEYKTFQANRDLKEFRPIAVNDPRIYKFIEEVYTLPRGNPIEPFEVSDDIIRYLREQWAGLFQRLLRDNKRQRELNTIESLKNTAATLNHLVTFLSEQQKEENAAIKDILLSSHPAFTAIKEAAKIPYRVVFHNKDELDALLGARMFAVDDTNKAYLTWTNNKLELGIRVFR